MADSLTLFYFDFFSFVLMVELSLYLTHSKLSFQIINWSCLDYFKTDLKNRWEFDNIFGTAFDIVVHLCMAYYLSHYLTVTQIILSLVLVQAGVLLVLFGPYYAWASPYNIPPWIQKRLHPDTLKGC